MRKYFTVFLLIIAVYWTVPVLAAVKDAGSRFVKRTDDRSIFGRIGSWFSKRIKPAEEKPQQKKEGVKARRVVKAGKTAENQRDILKKNALERQKELRAKMDEVQKELKAERVRRK